MALKVHGTRESGAESRLPLLSEKIPLKSAVRVDSATRDDTDLLNLDDVGDEDVVEVELQDGTVIWTRVDRLRADTRSVHQRGEGDDVLSSFFPVAGSDRGLVSWAIKSLRFFEVDIAKYSALRIAHRIEQGLAGPEGFYHIDASGNLTPDRIKAGSEKVLLFIHGTASSTNKAFQGMTRHPPSGSDLPDLTGRFRDLHKEYGGRVFGFEHRTLTETPAANVVRLLTDLPASNIPPIHVVSHSRGGLVGDLLAHGGLSAFPQAELEAYGVPADQHETYCRMSELLLSRAPRIERFVRIACPAAGTTLASGRLDIYLSILVGLVGKVPAFGPFLEGFGDLVVAVAKERTDPKVLPGLEAQMPTSGLVRALNGSGRTLKSDLTVIAGNSGGLLKNLANLFYWTANDLVVDTRSMYGGAQREQRLWYCAEGAAVDHCTYFKRAETVDKLIHGLTRKDADTSGFETIRPKGVSRAASLQPTDNAGKPCVILLPGIMGSHLAVNVDDQRKRIWLDPQSIIFHAISHLDVSSKSKVEPDGLIGLSYDDFIEFLRGAGHHVIPFAYDWRLSVNDAADRLDEIVRARKGASSSAIRFVGHSQGGLVVRAYMAQHSDQWNELVQKHDARLIQLGTPNGGSFLVAQILQGNEPLLRQLATLDLKTDLDDWIRIFAGFPGLLEMGPRDAAGFLDSAKWSRLNGIRSVPSEDDLTSASQTVQELDAVDLSEHPVIYVAGHAAATPTLTNSDNGTGTLQLGETPNGDGRVTWASGIPVGVPTYYINVEHGSMANDAESFDGIRELIESGATGRLARTAPKPIAASTRGLGPWAQAGGDIFPSERGLTIGALGMEDKEQWGRGRADRDPERPKTTVEIAHGDLTYARYPVMIGHYMGDTIVSAEAQLDRCLGGKLTQRNQLELYPGPVGSAEVVLQERDQLRSRTMPGAIVVGLGSVGSLTPGGLANTIKTGLLRYVNEVLDRGDNAIGLNVSTLLIGSGEAGLTMEQVIESILMGLNLANARLRHVRTDDDEPIASIGGLEILELYLDTALQALHVATRLSGERMQGITVRDTLRRLSGGERRMSYTPARGWWTRLVIGSDKARKNRLTFKVYGDRARVDETTLEVQSSLVDSMIESAMRSSRATTEGLPEAMFELLLPHALKGAAAERHNLVLGIDESSAQYPWEMLIDRKDPSGTPVAVAAGMVRQLDVRDPRPVSHPEDRNILVIGDPPSTMHPLAAASKEARAVADQFEARGEDWNVFRQINNDPGHSTITPHSIIHAVLTRDPRILHLAGHGVYDPLDPAQSGAVIGSDPNDPQKPVLFTPALVRQMRLTPELVFINCCHLGRITNTDTPRHLLAANLATGFIRAGVRAVVAAAWAVDDNAAETFASAFYSAILNGAPFGDAVRTARTQTWHKHRQTNTWSAYQCYGNPGFQLLADPGVRSQVRTPDYDHLLDPSEVIAELDNLVSRLQAKKKAKSKSDGRDSQSRLNALKAVAQARDWAVDCGVALAIARVHGELQEFGPAIDWFDKARAVDDGRITLHDLEQHANFIARHGADLARQSDSTNRTMGIELLERAVREIDSVLTCGKTAERWSIRGSASKRIASVQDAKSAKHIREMTESYARAAELRSGDWYYALTNALSGILLLGGPWDTPAKKDDFPFARTEDFNDKLREARQHVASLDVRSLWDAVADPDLRVIESLSSGKLADSVASICETYLSVLNVHGSPRELNSVLFQVEFLSNKLQRFAPGGQGPLSNKADRKKAAELLKSLDKQLRDRMKD